MKKLTALFALAATSAFAEVKLNGIFSDHMVLQRDRAVPVWGYAEPGEAVSVSFAGQTLKAVAKADGGGGMGSPAPGNASRAVFQPSMPSRHTSTLDGRAPVRIHWRRSASSNGP